MVYSVKFVISTYSIYSIIASPISNANLICKLVKIISPYVMHMIAPDIILYQEKYIQKFCHVYVLIWYVIWYFIDFPITWFPQVCVNISTLYLKWHIFGEQQHHVYYQLFSLHTIYLHCKVICWKTCKDISNT